MTQNANPYRFGDLLALARRNWVLRMAGELETRGFADYRTSDAAIVRQLRRGAVPVGQLGAGLGVTRQAARKLARGLEARGYATADPDPGDGRKVNVALTPMGRAYADAIVEVIAGLNRALAGRVRPEQLTAADAVLRAAVDDDQLARAAAQITPPAAGPTAAGPPAAGRAAAGRAAAGRAAAGPATGPTAGPTVAGAAAGRTSRG